MTALQAASITQGEMYRNYYRLQVRTVAQVDGVSARYLTRLCLSGECLAKAQRVLAAILFMDPIAGRGARGKLPQSAQAQRGFSFVASSASPAALPPAGDRHASRTPSFMEDQQVDAAPS